MSRPRDGIDPVEADLESLRPAPLGADLAARIGRELAGDGSTSRTRRFRGSAALFWIGGAAAAAACVVAAQTWRQAGPADGNRPVVAHATRPATPDGDADERPALSNYRRAASLSAGALDELLVRHSARTLVAPEAAPVTVSSRASLVP